MIPNWKSCTTDKRPRFQDCLEYVREGVDLKVIDQNIDTRDATGRLLFNMLGTVAQFETEIKSERQMNGIQKANERSVLFAPQAKLTQTQIIDLCQTKRRGGLD